MRSRQTSAALLVCGALVVSCSSTSDERGQGAGGPSSKTSASPLVPDARVVRLTQDLPGGEPPKVPYLVGKPLRATSWRLVRPTGTTVTVQAPPAAFASFADGLLVLATGEVSSVYAVRRDGHIERPASYTSNARLAVSDDGRAVGWVALIRDDRVPSGARAVPVIRFADGTGTRLPAGSAAARMVGIAGARCARDTAACRAVMSDRGRTYVLNHGRSVLVAPRAAVDVRADLATISPRSSPTTCSAMWSASGGRLWRDCHHDLYSFSPSGDHVLGGDSFAGTVATSRIVLLDDGGRTEATYAAPRGVTVSAATWEDDRHILVRLSRDWTTAYLVRVSVDGDAELVFASRGRRRSLVSYELPTS